jgi:hypothetical protein
LNGLGAEQRRKPWIQKTQGSNDLVNQRLVGEIHLDGFDVSHTKDSILWRDNQEEDVEEKLRNECGLARGAILVRSVSIIAPQCAHMRFRKSSISLAKSSSIPTVAESFRGSNPVGDATYLITSETEESLVAVTRELQVFNPAPVFGYPDPCRYDGRPQGETDAGVSN